MSSFFEVGWYTDLPDSSGHHGGLPRWVLPHLHRGHSAGQLQHHFQVLVVAVVVVGGVVLVVVVIELLAYYSCYCYLFAFVIDVKVLQYVQYKHGFLFNIALHFWGMISLLRTNRLCLHNTAVKTTTRKICWRRKTRHCDRRCRKRNHSGTWATAKNTGLFPILLSLWYHDKTMKKSRLNGKKKLNIWVG